MNKKVKSVNAYEKNGKKFVVIETEDKEVIYINYNFIKYALDNIKQVKGE